MTRRHSLLLVGVLLTLSVAGLTPQPDARAGGARLPDRLSDRQFWNLINELSEPDGMFRSDNLLSNEIYLQYVIPELVSTARPKQAYLGVGPEQNFTYIAALRPRMVFIVDVRRGNLHLHLLYKALFELSDNRVEFVSRLFSKETPPGLGSKSTAREIFAAFAKLDTSDTLYQRNLLDIEQHLLKKRKLPLSAVDLKGIEYVYHAFYWYGPIIQYWSSTGARGFRDAPTYVDLMIADDGQGQNRSFLATEESFTVVKELHAKNLFVPVVGNFAGPKALRAVGQFLRERDAMVAAFYLSNVEQYLNREGRWYEFCGNVATLPLDRTSTFIRSIRNGSYGRGVGLDSVLGNIAREVRACNAQ
ncbi:MAG TPA: hypothetical protein VFO14_20945 [Vicinamibacterales bacterium]|nr:hypothetical protein [Vicinamibacterales bacterium]